MTFANYCSLYVDTFTQRILFIKTLVCEVRPQDDYINHDNNIAYYKYIITLHLPSIEKKEKLYYTNRSPYRD